MSSPHDALAEAIRKPLALMADVLNDEACKDALEALDQLLAALRAGSGEPTVDIDPRGTDGWHGAGSGASEPRECEHKWRDYEGIGTVCRDCGTPLSQLGAQETLPSRATEEEPCTSAAPTTAARDSEDTPSTPATAPAGSRSSATAESTTSTQADASTARSATDTTSSPAPSSSAASDSSPHDETLREAMEEVAAAHQAVIEGVTPKHPNWCADDAEAYTARFSTWHTACYKLRAALAAARPDTTKASE